MCWIKKFVYIQAHMYLHRHICHAYMHSCVYVEFVICLHMYICVCVCIYTLSYTLSVCVCVYIYIYMATVTVNLFG